MPSSWARTCRYVGCLPGPFRETQISAYPPDSISANSRPQSEAPTYFLSSSKATRAGRGPSASVGPSPPFNATATRTIESRACCCPSTMWVSLLGNSLGRKPVKPTIEPNTPRTVRTALPTELAMLSDLIRRDLDCRGLICRELSCRDLSYRDLSCKDLSCRESCRNLSCRNLSCRNLSCSEAS